MKTIERFMNTRHFREWVCDQAMHSLARFSTSALNTLRMRSVLQQSCFPVTMCRHRGCRIMLSCSSFTAEPIPPTVNDIDALQVRAMEKTYLRTSETPPTISIWTSTQNMRFGENFSTLTPMRNAMCKNQKQTNVNKGRNHSII
jgi:hypothetical protein